MPAPIRVNLSPQHLQIAEAEAERRQGVNSRLGLKGRNGGAANGNKALDMHRLGTMGEVAVAVHLGLEAYLFSEQTAKRGSPDLPGDIEVKTRSRHSYDLIVQRDERPDKKLVLVTIQNGMVFIHGWCVAGDVMQERFWSDPAGNRPAYFVPKNNLRCIHELQELLNAGESSVVTPTK